MTDEQINAEIMRYGFGHLNMTGLRNLIRNCLATQHPSQSALKLAYDALRFYVDASEEELKERGLTRDTALRLARDAEVALLKEAEQHSSQSAGEPVAYLTMARDGLVRCARTTVPTPEQSALAVVDGDTIIPVYASPPPTDAARAEADRRDALEGARNEGFNAGTVAALAVIRAFDHETAWREVLNAAGEAQVLYHAAHENPDDWEWGGFAHYKLRKPRKRAALAAERNNGIRPAGGEHGE